MSNFTVQDLRQAYERRSTVIPRDFEEIVKQIDTDQNGDISKLEAKTFIKTVDNYRRGWRPDLQTIKHILEKKVLEEPPSPSRSFVLGEFRYHAFEKSSLSPWSESTFALPSEGGEFDFSIRYNMASLHRQGAVLMARAETGPGLFFSAYAPEKMITPEGFYQSSKPSNGIDDVGILQGAHVTVGIAPFGKMGVPLYVTTGVSASAQLGRVVYNSFKGEEGLPDPVFKVQATGAIDLGLCLPIKLGSAQTLLIEGGQELAGGSLSNIDGLTGSLFERNSTYARVTLQAN